VRVIIAMVLAVVMLPSVAPHVSAVEAFSLRAVALTLEQIAIGAVLGIGLQFATTALSIFGYLSASQTSLAMAMLNDPCMAAPRTRSRCWHC
jgi:flagellar biosynthetic protein FliR